MRKHTPLDLHSIKHSTCQKCGGDTREGNLDEGICRKIVSDTDKGPIRCVGSWAFDKVHFLTRYFDIFGNGMHKMWQGNVHYIEICSGPGRCINRDTADEMDGTAMAIMHKGAYPLYKSVTFFDRSQPVVDALNRRIGKLGQGTKTMALKADYTKATALVAACLERAPIGIVLIFLDPTDCSVPMDTVRALSQGLRNVDFIINVATGTDANRNVKTALTKPDSPVRKKYDRFLGSPDFCANPENLRLAETGRDDLLRAQFREAYQSALAEQGYNYRAVEVIKHYYDLVFASKHPTGLTFWKKAQSIRPDSQGTLDFGTEL